MDISAKNQELEAVFSDILVVGLFEDEKSPNERLKKLDNALDGIISEYLIKKEGFKAKFGKTVVVPTYLKIPADKIMLLGLGTKKEFDTVKLIELGSKIVRTAKKVLNAKSISVELPYCCQNSQEAASALAQGILIGNFEYDKYKTKKSENEIKKTRIITADAKAEKAAKSGINTAKAICLAMDFTKNLVYEPAQNATPEAIADIAKEISKNSGLEFEVFNKKQLEEMKFGAFLGVGQGSVHEPKFIHLTYKAQNPKKTIVLIGKGITFDSGGLDIKPASSMLTMKTDMTGAATVLGVIQALATLKPEADVHVLSALCENMPSGSSYKPGDVLTAKNGKTIEVDNTDAEGRLTLADALCFADELNADEVIDIATLTGAAIVALGQNITAVMGNNDEQIKRIIKIGEKSGETLWQLPIFDNMQEALKSDIADMRNTGSRFAGSSVAGRFLQNFTKNKNWLHLDIAGTAFIDKPHKELSKGATGVMVRTLVNYIMSI